MPRSTRMPLDRLAANHPELSDDGTALQQRVARLERIEGPRLLRLWEYYRNPRVPASRYGDTSARPYDQAQEWGLPLRITGDGSTEVKRKEIVIENDIGWRVDAMVDFLFGQPIVISSAVTEESRRARIDALIRAIFAHSGGISFLQKLAVLGAVYGQVDILVKYVGPTSAAAIATSQAPQQPACDAQMLGDRDGTTEADDYQRDALLASMIRFEIVEPTRAVPLLCAVDPSAVIAYAQSYRVPRTSRPAVQINRGSSWLNALNVFKGRTVARLDRGGDATALNGNVELVRILEVISATRWQRYEDGRLIDEGENSLGRLPLVHVQNTAVPFEYGGASDVEPLMPLQDELNTRLSDRAYRITMRSSKMYLGKGIDNFLTTPVGPGKMFATDNVDASIEEFGGDSACPSEQVHIDEIREALDKTSGVSPIAAGAIKGRIGRLSSAAALRVTLLALLGRTERKRTTYGPAISQLCELALAWLDRAGHFPTAPGERRVNVYWPNPVPANESEQIDAAKSKTDLGIDPKQVARELGY